MSNIDKQALREAAEAAIGAHERLSVMPPDDIFDISLAEGTQLDADITALNALNSTANPATVLALLDELEAAEKLNAELMEKQRLIDICQGQGLEHRIAAEKRAEAAEKRIAELESKEQHSERQSVIDALASSGEEWSDIEEYMQKWDAARAAAAGKGE
ncbi:TPA: ead/Ea22-like family protein [Enterobacter chengduensis]